MTAFDTEVGSAVDSLDTMIAALAKPAAPVRRRLTADEKRLVLALVDRAALYVSQEWLDEVQVVPTETGASSLRFLPAYPAQACGRRAAELHFTDADGVDAIACLSLDRAGLPFALEIVRADRGPLRRIPATF